MRYIVKELDAYFYRPLRNALWVGMSLFCLIIHSENSAAETTNKRLILPGATAQAIGGAFTAIANDASAGYYNPAGLGFLTGPGVSATVNSYGRSRKSVSGVTATENLRENSSSLYPGFAGGNSTFGPFSLGWSYFTLEHQNTDESQTIAVPATETTSAFTYDRANLIAGNLFHAGGSIALKIGDSLSLGVSEFYYRRQKQATLKERSTYSSGVFYDSFVSQSTINEGTTTVVGALLRLGTISFGCAGKIPKALSDKTEYQTASITYTSLPPELSKATSITHREDELIVRTYSFGVAWQPSPYFLVSAENLHYPSTKSPWPTAGGFDTKMVNDWSAGFKVGASSIALTGGIFTNSSLVKTPTPSLTTSDPMRVDYQGITAGLSFKSKQSESMIIFARQVGSGQTQMIQGDLSLQDVSQEIQSLSLATSYSF